MTDKPKISFIIPFFNDQDRVIPRLKEVLQYFENQEASYEIILVDDGSREDRSKEIQGLYPQVRIIRYEKNKGKGQAVRTGMLAAQGKYRFFTDSDIPFGMDPLPVGLKYLEEKEFDLVIGDRNAPGSVYHVEQSFFRRILSKVFTSFINWLVVTGVRDTQCGFKGFSAKTAEFIFSRARLKRFAFDVEIVYISFKHNLDPKPIYF